MVRRRDRLVDRARRRPFGARPRAPRAPAGSPPARPPRRRSYQSEIYLDGMSADVKPIFTTNLSDLEGAAAEVLPEASRLHLLAWLGLRRRRAQRAQTLRAWRIVPRMFIDRDERDLSATVLRYDAGPGHPRPGRGPGPGQSLRRGPGVARAAEALGLTYVLLVAFEHVGRGCRRRRAHRLAVVRHRLAGGRALTSRCSGARGSQGAPTSCSTPCGSPERAGRRSRRSARPGRADRPRRVSAEPCRTRGRPSAVASTASS